jgi:hypothetical protein
MVKLLLLCLRDLELNAMTDYKLKNYVWLAIIALYAIVAIVINLG